MGREARTHDTANLGAVLTMRGITKRFGPTIANDGIDLDLHRGEALGILGENGAGKSTLMNILYGMYQPDAGRITIDGTQVDIRSPQDAVALGIGMVHQHFMLIDALTVAENVILGSEPRRRLLIDRGEAEREVEQLATRLGLDVDPRARTGELSIGQQQRVEILKALYRDARILVMDEPTAVLTPQEIRGLFAKLHDLTATGLSVCLITHKLDELLDVADRITVVRDGRIVETIPAAEATREGLARMMVGRDVSLTVDKPPMPVGPPRLRVSAIRVTVDQRHVVDDIDLTVHGGEIVGVAGIDGNGQVELAEAIAGIRHVESGSVVLEDRDVTGLGARQRLELGLAYVPEDRQHKGLITAMPVYENAVLKVYYRRPFVVRGLLRLQAMRTFASALVERFGVRPNRTDLRASALSGGNQQKLILARELAGDPQVLIAAQPTRGVDVAAIEEIHRQILQQRADGKAVLLFSLDLDEILALSDRIVVMSGGRIAGELNAADASEDELGMLMGGGAARRQEVDT